VQLIEKTSAFKRFGGPIQLASNAMQLYKELDSDLYDQIESKFTWTGNLTNGIKDGIRDEWYAKFDLGTPAANRNMPYTGVIERPDLQQILLDNLAEGVVNNGVGVDSYTTVGSAVDVKLEDERIVPGDVLVGADGIWSAVRRQMYDEGPIRGVSADGKVKQGCAYSGYTVFAGEAVLPLADYYDVGYNVYIGPQRYFVKSDVGDGRVQWYAFCALPPGSAKAGDSWENTGTSDAQGTSVIDYIRGLHEGWSDEISHILERTPAAFVE
jgi:zeaxanthin epoxidase